MTTESNRIKAEEILTKAKKIREGIDERLIPARRLLEVKVKNGEVNPGLLVGWNISINDYEAEYIALINEANALLRA